jgi:hypothetical protein
VSHNLAAGVQDVGIKQDTALKRAFKQAGEAGRLRDSCSLIASMHMSPGPLGCSMDITRPPAALPQPPAQTQEQQQQHHQRQQPVAVPDDRALMADVTSRCLNEPCGALRAPRGSGDAAHDHSGITPLLGDSATRNCLLDS